MSSRTINSKNESLVAVKSLKTLSLKEGREKSNDENEESKEEKTTNEISPFEKLEDTTLDGAPIQLQLLFDHFQIETMTKGEVLFLLVYLVALETGLSGKKAFKHCASELKYDYIVTSYFKRHNVHRLAKEKPEFTSDKAGSKFSTKFCSIASERLIREADIDYDTISARLSGIVTGELLLLTLTPEHRDEEGHCEKSLCLTIPRYILGNASNQNQNKALHARLRNMDELSFQLREELFVPLRSYHLELLELDTYPSISALPYEVYEEIFKHLSRNQLHILANVNKQLYNCVVNSKVYKQKNVPLESISNKVSFLSPSRGSSSTVEFLPYF